MIALASLGVASCGVEERGFAIVVDTQTYNEAKIEIDAYADAVEKYNGMKTYIIEDTWGIPDSIRATLQNLYTSKNVEGAAFIGDIPVVMTRDAQHFTSAFKMDQQAFERRQSSVPSDRFYTDFDLKWNLIEKDEELPYFYYSLTAESAQRTNSELYSGRIRPMDENGAVRIDLLKSYLKKVVAAKANNELLDRAFYFSGHGYISESLVARIDEKKGMYEHFPWLQGQQDKISYIDHKQEDVVKFKLMNELMRPDLDYAILHHHGNWDTQYLSGNPEVHHVGDAIDFVKRYVRQHVVGGVRKGLNADSLMRAYSKRMDLGQSWMNDYNKSERMLEDSLFRADMNLTLEDFSKHAYRPNVKVVNIDACYCGSFHQHNSIANEYIFSEGNNIAVIANSVNVLQDKWSDKLTGLIGLGMPVGQVTRYIPFLEAHTIGDPTFTFASADTRYDIGAMIANEATNWRRELKSEYADVRCLAMIELYEDGSIESDELLDIYKSSKYGMVRAQAMELLADCNDDNFIEAIALATHDSYEMNQRFALKYIFKTGDDRLIDALISVCIMNNTSERTNFNATYAMSIFPQDKLLASFEKAFDDESVVYLDKEKTGEEIRKAIISCSTKWDEEVEQAITNEASDKKMKFSLSMFRNYGVHYEFERLLELIPNLKTDELKMVLIEALGWHVYSSKKDIVIAKMLEIKDDLSYSQDVRKEALKSYNRLKDGSKN